MGSRLGIGMAVLLALCFASTTARAGKLDRAGNEAHSQSSSSGSGSSSSHGGGSSEEEDALGELFLVILSLPWSLPNVLVESGREEGASYRTGFQDYPYAEGSQGHLVEGHPGIALQLSADTGIDVGGDVWRHGLGLRLQFPARLELESEWSLFMEYGDDGTDRLLLGREILAVRFAENESIQFRTGIGPRHLVDDEGWVHGFDVLYGFDLFAGSPMVLSLEGSLGGVGGAFAPGARASLGVMLGRFEVRAGWDQRNIGNVSLGGPALGVRAWL